MARSTEIDRMITKLARTQFGVVTRAQLTALGIGDKPIQVRLGRGFLVRIHRGVFAVGHAALSERGRMFAALAVCGDDAVISHLSAANLYDISRFSATSIHVVVPSHRASHSGLTVHRTTSLPAWHWNRRNGIRRTTVARTLFDLADSKTEWQLTNLMNKAHRKRMLRTDHLERMLVEWPGRVGRGRMGRALGLHAMGSAGTKSWLEDECLDLILRAGLPVPLVNVHVRFGVQSFELDFHWPDLRLNVEVDPFGHTVPMRRLRDEERDFVMGEAGWRVLRIPGDDVEARSTTVVARIRAAMAEV